MWIPTGLEYGLESRVGAEVDLKGGLKVGGFVEDFSSGLDKDRSYGWDEDLS